MAIKIVLLSRAVTTYTSWLRELECCEQLIESQNKSELLYHIFQDKPHILVIDCLEKSGIINTVKEAHRFARQIPIIVIGEENDDLSVALVKQGVQDYLIRTTLTRKHLKRTIRYTLERQKILSRLKEANDEIQKLNDTLEDKVIEKTRDLLKSKEEAEKHLSIRTSFLNNISHEVRTPITAISGCLQLIKQKGFPVEMRPFIEVMGESCDRIITFFENILDLTLLKNDGITLNNHPFELEDLIQYLVRYTESKIQEQAVTFRPILIDTEHHKLTGDAYYITKMLRYILDNAVKFTKKGHIEMQVSVKELDIDRKEVQFLISNTGGPIHDEDQKKIFEEFITGGKEECYPQGVGLGLAISKCIASSMGGSICFQHDIDKGNQFFSSIPLKSRN